MYKQKIKEKLKFIWLFRAAWIEQLIQSIIIIGGIAIAALFITACGSVGTITRFADGTVSETHAFTLGSTAAVSDFKDSIKTANKTGRTISFGSVHNDVNVEALEQSNQLLGTLVGAAVKAAK